MTRTRKTPGNDTTTTTEITTMTTKNDLREKATKALAVKAEADGKVEAARTRCRATNQRQDATTGERFERLQAEIRMLEAEDDARPATLSATAALDAAELAEGDELATVASIGRLHGDLVVLLAEEDRIQAELNAAVQKTHARFAAAQDAEAKLAARRRAAGLPPPAHIPQSVDVFGRASPRNSLEALRRAEIEGPTSKESNAARLRPLRVAETEHLAFLESEIRKKEDAKEREAAFARWRKEDDKEKARVAAEEHAAMQKHYDAKKAEKEELAAAHRARTS